MSSLSSFRIPTENLNKDVVDEFLAGRTDSFNLLLNENKSIERIGSYLDYEDDQYEKILDLVLEDNNDIGEITFGDNVWMYKITSIDEYKTDNTLNEYEYRIAFVEITNDKQMLNTLLLSLVSIFVFMIVIIYIISLYFANKAIKPLNVLWNKQKQFVADASHELKTPLTIISANTDLLLLNKEEKIKNQMKWLEYIKSETKGMNKLINELLNSAKAEEDKYNFESINISELINEIVLSFETIVFEKNIKFNINVDDNLILNTDPNKFRQVAIILLDNAIKYVDEKGKINIKLYKDKKNIILDITNTGIGIDKEDLPHIFERFYKSDKARTNNNSNSFGLGLYIAKTITTKLNGNIKCISEKNKNTSFIIKF